MVVSRSIVVVSPEEHAERIARVKHHLRQWLLSTRMGGDAGAQRPAPLKVRSEVGDG